MVSACRWALALTTLMALLYNFLYFPARMQLRGDKAPAVPVLTTMSLLEPLFHNAMTQANSLPSWMATDDHPGGLVRRFINATINLCEDYLKNHHHDNFTDPYPYWAFVPVPVGQGYLKPGESLLAAPNDACWSVNFTSEYKEGFIHGLWDHVEVSASASQTNVHCKSGQSLPEDIYLVATLDDFSFLKVGKAGVLKHRVGVGMEKSKIWDAKTRGVRVFHINGGQDKAVWSLLETVRLFEPLLSNPSVSLNSATRNRDFLKKYAGLDINVRTGETKINISEDLVQDGDFLGLQRLDGLDPMLAWAMGSSTGHTAIALRFNGVLHVVESTSSTEYWPVNGMQKTEWNLWLERYRKANYAIVHMPLSAKSRQRFNATAAREAFETEYEGFDYGYENMLFSWIDSIAGNFPCMPAEAQTQGCLSWAVWEVLVAILEKFDSSIAEKMFLQAQRRRAGLDEGSWAQILQAGYENFNGDVTKVATQVEQDSWLYKTSRNGKKADGPARMCDALVCSLWKAGGLFGDLADKIQCTEFTNWDAWGLQLFDADWPAKRPDICKKADPDNEFCQLSGEYTLHLRTPMYTWNERPLVAHMAENCPSLAPKYIRPLDC